MRVHFFLVGYSRVITTSGSLRDSFYTFVSLSPTFPGGPGHSSFSVAPQGAEGWTITPKK